MLGTALTALGSLASGIINTAGSIYTNKQNLKAQQSTNETNWQIAALNNATQIDMANTAHQREVEDLQAAGLNPILSTGGSGASTPSLTNSRGEAVRMDNPASGLAEGVANSAKAVGRLLTEQYKTDLQQAKEDVKLTEAEREQVQRQNALEAKRYKNEWMRLEAEHAALFDLTQDVYKDHQSGAWTHDLNRNGDYYRLLKEGMISDLKDRSNRNWRNNLGVINQSVNSASSLMPWQIKRKLRGK